MLRRELAPPATLKSDVKCFWVLEEEQTTFNTEFVIPDPYIELIINCGAPMTLHPNSDSSVPLPRVFLNGLQTKPQTFQVSGPCQFIAMRIFPWALATRLETLKQPESITPLDAEWQARGQTIQAIFQRRGYEEAIYCLQDMVMRLNGCSLEQLQPVHNAAKLLFATDGRLRMDELAARHYLSISQLERRFKQTTGVTPKTFARLIRFRALCNVLRTDPKCNTHDLAYSFGYADQSHMIHDFKALSSYTPANFAAHSEASQHRWQSADFSQYTEA